MGSVEKSSESSSSLYANALLKRRSISLNTGVPLTQVEAEQLNYYLQEKLSITSSSTNVSTIVKAKLRSFGRQIHRHMIETVNVTNDVSHRIPRSAMGDIYFSKCSPVDLTNSNTISHRRRSAKLSLELEGTRKYMRVYDTIFDATQSCSGPKFQEITIVENKQNIDGSVKRKVSNKRRLSTSVPHLKEVELFNESGRRTNQSNTVSEETKLFTSKTIRPKEVSYDDQGQTWEIYGADQDPNALGQAIENHLEKMMQRKQREQRCFSLSSEFSRQNTSSTKSSSRASHTGEQLLQAARRRFRRRAVSSVTANTTNASTEEHSPERENHGRRSRFLSYISRLIRRSSTSALSGRRRDLLHQDSILECGEQKPDVEKVMISAT